MVRVYDRSDSAEDFYGHAGSGGDQARQEAPEPCVSIGSQFWL